jgi:peptidoglycan-N-acetylglucosamine deacetylase
VGPSLARAAAAGAVAGAAAWSLPALAPVVPAVSSLLRIPRKRIGEAREVCITFDDGPHAEGTPAVLAALAKAGATATFFLVGEQVERRPALAAEIVAAGHAIALHGHRHRNQLRVAPSLLDDDTRRGAEALSAATGREPRTYRPPYGIFSAAGLGVARRRGLEPLLWSRWGRDWRAGVTPAAISESVAAGLLPGDVLLLHDSDAYSAAGSWRRTAAALPVVLDSIERAGLRPVVV